MIEFRLCNVLSATITVITVITVYIDFKIYFVFLMYVVLYCIIVRRFDLFLFGKAPYKCMLIIIIMAW